MGAFNPPMAERLQQNIRDLEELGKQLTNSGRAGDGKKIDEAVKVMKKELSELKKLMSDQGDRGTTLRM
jgi:hypothetical protein